MPESFPASRGRRGLSALLLLAFCGLVFWYLWWGRFAYFKAACLGITWVLGGLILAFQQWIFRPGRKHLGLRLDNLATASRLSLLPHLAFLLGLFLWIVAGPGEELSWKNSTLLYFPWALGQQYVLQNFFLRRWNSLVQRPWLAVLLAGTTFSVLHFPNVPLMAATLVGGIFWCSLFVRVPNLFAVAASHGLAGVLIVSTAGVDALNQLHVGRPGFPYSTFGDGVLVAGGYGPARQPLIVTLPGPDRGNPSRVRVFSPDGTMLNEWQAFPEYDFSGNLAVGDLGYQEGDEIAVAPGPGRTNPAEVRIFSLAGRELERFQLPGSSGYGAFVSIYNRKLVVARGPEPGSPPEVFEYIAGSSLRRCGSFPGTRFHNGGKAMLFDRFGQESPSLLLWGHALSVNSSEIETYTSEKQPPEVWPTIGTVFGVNLSPIRLAGGDVGLIAAPGSAPGHDPHLKILNRRGEEIQNFFAYPTDIPCGNPVTTVDVDADGIDEIVLGEGACAEQPARVTIITLQGDILQQWKAY